MKERKWEKYKNNMYKRGTHIKQFYFYPVTFHSLTQAPLIRFNTFPFLAHANSQPILFSQKQR